MSSTGEAPAICHLIVSTFEGVAGLPRQVDDISPAAGAHALARRLAKTSGGVTVAS